MRSRLGPADLRDGEVRGYRAGDRRLLVVRRDGAYKALDDWCNHAGCLLSGGRLEGNLIVCPCHEAKFDLDTGRNMTLPRLCEDQATMKLVVEDGQLYVED